MCLNLFLKKFYIFQKNHRNIYKSLFFRYFMKKSLLIISFAFIFLLSMSFVSAGFFDWLTGDAIGTRAQTDVRPAGVLGAGADCIPACCCTDPISCAYGASCATTSIANARAELGLPPLGGFTFAVSPRTRDSTSSTTPYINRDSTRLYVDNEWHQINPQTRAVTTTSGTFTVAQSQSPQIPFLGRRASTTTVTYIPHGLSGAYLNPECKKVEGNSCKDDSECLLNKKFIGSTCGVDSKCKCLGIRGCPATGGTTGGDISVTPVVP